MEVVLSGKNLFIIDKKPQIAGRIYNQEAILLFKNDEGEVLEHGKLDLQRDLYACLYCKQLKNITFIVKKDSAFAVSLIVADEIQFESVLRLIREACPELELSEQNAKINGYVNSLVEKLKEGVAVTIMDTKEESAIKYCSVCGMQCDPNIPYCMECGASV